MDKNNYGQKYDELKEKYDILEADFKKINSELYYIKNSRFFKLMVIIRKIFNPIRNIFKFLTVKSINKLKIKKFLNNSQKIVIIPSSFEFDEFVNQRPINYAKFLASNNYKVIFVVWQWDKSTKISNKYKVVFKNVFQVPLYEFLDFDMDYSSINQKIFYINFPNKIFVKLSYKLRKQGFIVHYDIMDEWEEFKKVGQASWYEKNIEEKIILESDFVSAVSPYLIQKFKHLRDDILLSPNGFYKKITGDLNKNISLRKIENGVVNIGYFGHLTDSWFDWNLIFDIAKKNSNYIFHIIGYGISDEILEKLEKFKNIYYYGKVSTNLLYKYVEKWNIGIIPFKKSNLAKAVDPIKIYEYLYMGLPVIVSGIEHLKSYPKTYVIENSEEFTDCVKNLMNNSIDNNIDNFLDNSTWEARFAKFLTLYKKKGINDLYEK